MWVRVLRKEIFFLATLAAVENIARGCATGSGKQ